VNGASIPPGFMDCVVALGHEEPVRGLDGKPVIPSQSKWFTEGTGYFYGYLTVNDPDYAKRKYQLFLVTAKHVIAGHQQVDPNGIAIRLNPQKERGKANEFWIPSEPPPDGNRWFFPNDNTVDLALIPINADILKSQGIQFAFFANDLHTANVDKLKSIGTSAGDSIFVLGFPMNMAGE